MDYKKYGMMAAAYLGIGALVTVWTIARVGAKKPAFNGLSPDTSPAMGAHQTVVLWPYAAFKNITTEV